MVNFKLHGFHILDRLNEHLKREHGIFELLVIGSRYPTERDADEIKLQAIFYDTKRKEYQPFNIRWHLIYNDEPLNVLFEIFLDDIYLNMVFSVETNGMIDPIHKKRIYTFRDILAYAYKHGKLPEPTRDIHDVRNYQDAFDDTTKREHPSRLQLKSHS